MQFRAMAEPVNDQDEATREANNDPGVEPGTPLSEDALLDLLDALVEERGRVPAAQVLGVNYRTLALCCDSLQVSRRMSRALLEFRNWGGDSGGEREDGDADAAPDGGEAALPRRVAELEDSKQAEEVAKIDGIAEVVDADADAANVHEHGDSGRQDWRPPRRRPGMPDAGVVTLDEQADEEHAFGPAKALAPEWWSVRSSGQAPGRRVDRAVARVRR